MEKYIRRCLDTFIIGEEEMNMIEVLVINDGSKDSSSRIAHEYEDKYPNTFRVIDKDNGHYGSCINRGLVESKGKYLRIVDADDWVDSEGLSKFISLLSERNEDVIFTRFTIQYISKNTQKTCETDGIVWNKTYDLSKDSIPMNCLAMHGITIKSDLLRRINYRQTEGIAYTDTEFVYFPLCQAENMYCCNIDLYQYFMGREGQTMSKASIIKGYSDFRILYDNIFIYKPLHPNISFEFIRSVYLSRILGYMLTVHLLYKPFDDDMNIQLRKYIEILRCSSPSSFDKTLDLSVRGIHYVRNWYYRGLKYLVQNILFLVYRKLVLG